MPSSKSSSSGYYNTEDEEYVCSVLDLLALNQDCNRMFDNDMNMMARHENKMGNDDVPIFQRAVNEDPTLFELTLARNPAAMYAMREALVLIQY